MTAIFNRTAEVFADPRSDGVIKIPGFIDLKELTAIDQELQDPNKVAWWDSHDRYTNARGLDIVQNYNAYALKLSRGDQTAYQKLDALKNAAEKTQVFVRSLGSIFPSLLNWSADELSLHRYDRDVGLSRHMDSKRFVGVIAIASLQGECNLAIYKDSIAKAYTTKPGDLILLRAPGLIETEADLRPEHGVVDIAHPPRTSMMLRANNSPNEILPGSKFANWP